MIFTPSGFVKFTVGAGDESLESKYEGRSWLHDNCEPLMRCADQNIIAKRVRRSGAKRTREGEQLRSE